MTRDEGFRTADVDTGLLDDPKMRALWRSLRDPAAMSRAVVAYLAAVLASWRTGERVTAEDAAPLWSDPDPDVLDAMTAAGLLDAEHRIPAHVWTSWYEPAAERQQNFRASNRLGGLRARGTRTREEALALLNAPTVPVIVPLIRPTDTPASPVRPVLTVPSDSPTTARPSKEDDELRREIDAAAAFTLARRAGRLPTPADPRPLAAILADLPTTTTGAIQP